MPTVDHRVGRALSRLRQEAGLSQHELGKRLNVGQAAVSKWEAGAPMSVANLWAAAEAMRVPPWLLLALAETDDGRVVAPGMLATVRALLARPVGDTMP